MRRRLAIALGLFVAGCGSTSCAGKGPGVACASTAECRELHVCAPSLDDVTRCMLPCDEGTFLCTDGSLCLDRGADGRLCWFGGRTPYRMPCADTPECEAGTVCVAGDIQPTCEQACTPDANLICRTGVESCVPLAVGGWCQPLPMPDDGSVDDGSVDGATTP